MATWRVVLAVQIGAAIASVHGAGAAESREIYRRATLVETRTGVVTLRSVQGALLDVPVDCAEGGLKCREAVRFPTIYALSFGLESRESRQAASSLDVVDRGTVYLALRFEAADEGAFADELRATFAALSADAFAGAFASLDNDEPPFSSIRERSVEPSWSCFENGSSRLVTRYSRVAGKFPDGSWGVSSVSTDTYQGTEITGPLCEDVAKLVEAAQPEEIRTVPVPRVVRETVVRARVANELGREVYPDALVTLPQGASFTTEPAGPGGGEQTSTATDGSVFMASRTEGGVKRTAVTVSAELPPAAVTRGAWLSRFTLETVERRLGPLPTEEVLDRSALLAVLLPTFPAVPVGDKEPQPVARRETYSIRFDPQTFLETVAQRLDRQAVVDAATVEEAITLRPAGLESEGWVLVVCRHDGTADYGLPPMRARSRLTNAALFCAAADARVE
jgi:hypothetical protein